MDINATKKYLELRDYSISQENFELFLDENYQLLKTIPQPTTQNFVRYYQSEDYISHTDSRRNLFEILYQIVKKIAIRKKIALIDKVSSNKKGLLLDIGMGTGDFLLGAKKRNWDVLGFEPNLKAKEMALEKGLKIVNILEDIPDNSVDVITMWHVLEHIPDLEHTILELNRILVDKGSLIIALPNFKSYDAKYYGKHWAAYDVPRHLWHFSQCSIKKIFSRYGFVLKNKYPMFFDSYYVSLLSEKYKNKKMNFVKAFYIGFKSNLKAKKSTEYSSIIYVLKKAYI